ncbi:hypothetical protein F4Z99_05550 [Candidatus Poribacteria bacterium]|nr:hypothetical protein [Candidatus Poribacteria bacterium]MYB00475.1 hypothetical protein [Candidatus Poribacteria bacterium]
MQNILEDTGDAAAMPQQHPGLVSRIFRDYRNNLGLFWQVMLPLIIINFLFYLGTFPFAKLMSPEGQWTISTDSGLTAYTSSSESVQPVGVVWGTHLGVSSTHISFLWLAMCPLIFVIVQRRNGIDTTFKAVWQQTFRKTVPILGAAFFIGMLFFGVPIIFGFLTFEFFFQELVQSNAPTLVFVFSCIFAAWFVLSAYFTVKWSLYNQGIMIENLSAIAALRRSNELVRGSTWWKFLGIYLLLTLAFTALTSLLLGLTMALLSFAAPEFIPMREALLPGRFISLLFFGYAKITLENAPSFWTVGVIFGVYTLICAALAPIWASLTTQLYMERADEHAQQVSA